MQVIHIGAPKTGSTLIQNVLDDSREALAKSGLLVPELGWGRGNGHIGFRNCLNKNANEKPEAEAIRKYYNDLFAAKEQFLVSTETLWTILPQAIHRVFNNLEDCHIVAVLRSQQDLVVSHYCQKLKGANETRTPQKFLEDEIAQYDYLEKITLWKKMFGEDRVHVMFYEDMVQGDGLVMGFMRNLSKIMNLDLLAHISEDYLNEIGKKRVNMRLPDWVYEVFMKINETELPLAEKSALKKILIEGVNMQGGNSIFSTSGMANFRSLVETTYKKQNLNLIESLGQSADNLKKY